MYKIFCSFTWEKLKLSVHLQALLLVYWYTFNHFSLYKSVLIIYLENWHNFYKKKKTSKLEFILFFFAWLSMDYFFLFFFCTRIILGHIHSFEQKFCMSLFFCRVKKKKCLQKQKWGWEILAGKAKHFLGMSKYQIT